MNLASISSISGTDSGGVPQNACRELNLAQLSRGIFCANLGLFRLHEDKALSFRQYTYRPVPVRENQECDYRAQAYAEAQQFVGKSLAYPTTAQ